MRLTDIFAAFASSWPADKINTSWPPTTDGSGLAAQAAKAIEVEDVVSHIGADDTVTITGRLTLVAGVQPAATRLTSHLFPSLGFTFAPEAGWRSDFRASVVPGGDATVQIDTLPLIVFIPPDLLRAHDVPAATDPSSGIQLSENANDTEIKRDFSFLFDAQREIHLEPHLPISIGPCTLFGLPAKAVHELTLIASTPNARAQVDWLVRGFDDTQIPLQGGVLAFGGIELDWDVPRSALNDLRARLRLRHDAHVIIEDLALPSVLLRPVPLHGALGVRRSLDIGESLAENFTFADAPHSAGCPHHAPLAE